MTRAAMVFLLLTAVAHGAATERIAVSPDGKGFVQVSSNSAFTPWGFNYDRDYKMRLIEDYWAEEWATVEEDFREMKELGANVVRIHLQFGRFMDAPDKPNESNLARLAPLCRFANQIGLYLDITGLASYRKEDVPAWYDDLSEPDRWRAQARFWEAIARTCADLPGVFCYNLMNEPVVPDKKLPEKQWLVPFALGGFYYVQNISLDPAGRDRTEIARAWTRQMTAAIRKHDQKTLVTIGMLPFAGPGFDPKALAPDLGYISVHIYPERDKPDDAMKTLKEFAVGKPVVIEEIFPIHASAKDVARFIEESRPLASGWISFYWGKTPAEMKASKEISDAITLEWLKWFAPTLRKLPDRAPAPLQPR